MTLKKQIALVTGATGGIGGAVASMLAQQAVTLCISGRDTSKLSATVDRLRARSSGIDGYRCDLTSDSQIEAMCDDVANKYGRLDILIHSAGALDHGKLADIPPESFDRLYHANVRGPLVLTQKLLPLLKKPRGQIVFINSSVGLNARGNTGHYSATKHALKAVADGLRDENNADEIRILSVFPGRTATPLMQALCEKEGRRFQPELLLQPEDVASVVVNALTLPWTAEVTNISIRPMLKSY